MRYHIFKGKNRTTVHLDSILSDLLAIKLGTTPGTPEAKKAVRGWLQAQIDLEDDPLRVATSQWLRGEVVLFLTDREVVERYHAFLTQ